MAPCCPSLMSECDTYPRRRGGAGERCYRAGRVPLDASAARGEDALVPAFLERHREAAVDGAVAVDQLGRTVARVAVQPWVHRPRQPHHLGRHRIARRRLQTLQERVKSERVGEHGQPSRSKRSAVSGPCTRPTDGKRVDGSKGERRTRVVEETVDFLFVAAPYRGLARRCRHRAQRRAWRLLEVNGAVAGVARHPGVSPPRGRSVPTGDGRGEEYQPHPAPHWDSY